MPQPNDLSRSLVALDQNSTSPLIGTPQPRNPCADPFRPVIGARRRPPCGAPTVRFAADSLLEGNGFELPVPRAMQGRPEAIIADFGCMPPSLDYLQLPKRNLGTEALPRAEREVRIHFPPAKSRVRTRSCRANRAEQRSPDRGVVERRIAVVEGHDAVRRCEMRDDGYVGIVGDLVGEIAGRVLPPVDLAAAQCGRCRLKEPLAPMGSAS